MSRPLIITDCDEVLLHMVVPFAAWLDEAHQIEFRIKGARFSDALHRRCGTPVERDEVWPLLDAFFTGEMHRQYAIEGAFEALGRLREIADIVVCSNVGDSIHGLRCEQLQRHGLDCALVANRGPKGPALAKIIAEHAPSVAVYIDDLAVHIDSAAEHVPDVWRLHMIAEPRVAGDVEPAPHAHARIDDWERAETWIRARLAEGPAPLPEPAANLTESEA